MLNKGWGIFSDIYNLKVEGYSVIYVTLRLMGIQLYTTFFFFLNFFFFIQA